MNRLSWIGFVMASSVTGSSVMAQSNAEEGIDVALIEIDDLSQVGRTGTFPNGESGVSMLTTCCNFGTTNVRWRAPMDEDHPMIAFMMTRELNGRMEQISDWSYVKHGFFSTNSPGCGSCSGGSGNFLTVGCSDTYAVGNNSDRNWLGPPAEIDPWLGTWDPVCSHFDQGEPAVAAPADCDGSRSLTQPMINALGPVRHRMEISDADLNEPTADYYYYSQYVVRREPENVRLNNSGTRKVNPSWNGTRWNFFDQDALVWGSPLDRWTGAEVSSVLNGKDDGRVYLGAVVTGPDGNGMYHYEYAIHNRDNSRGIGSFQIPVCPGATVQNLSFGDLDDLAANDWSMAFQGGAVRFEGTANPVEWNTIYNFSFDCDAAPISDQAILMGQARAGSGADVLVLAGQAPLGPSGALDLGFAKAGGNGLEPSLQLCGGFGIGETGDLTLRNAPASTGTFLLLSDQSNPTPYKNGTLVPIPFFLLQFAMTDANGEITASAGGFDNTVTLYAQFVVSDPLADRGVSMSNALEIPVN